MSVDRETAYENFWTNKDTADKLLEVGWWAEKEPGAFDDAWDKFDDEVLWPSGCMAKNLWSLDSERQQLFLDWLDNSGNLSWGYYIDQAFNNYCSNQPELEDYGVDR